MDKRSFTAMLIDRDPGAQPYVIAEDHISTGGALLRAGRGVALGTIVRGLDRVTALELDPATGNYLVCENGKASILKKDGTTVATIAVSGGKAARVNQDGTAWIATHWLATRSSGVARIDLVRRVVTTIVPAPWSYGVEVYGSRKVVCNGTGKPGTSVKVNLQSRKSGDKGESYALACSFNRRPPSPSKCLKFPNGEYLFLDFSDPLFWTSLHGLVPDVFQNFRGKTDKNGNATAQVNIPSTLPPNLRVTIFVAGVIFDATGVRTVTNTHWFVLQ